MAAILPLKGPVRTATLVSANFKGLGRAYAGPVCPVALATMRPQLLRSWTSWRLEVVVSNELQIEFETILDGRPNCVSTPVRCAKISRWSFPSKTSGYDQKRKVPRGTLRLPQPCQAFSRIVDLGSRFSIPQVLGTETYNMKWPVFQLLRTRWSNDTTSSDSLTPA